MAETRDILWRFLGDSKNLNQATRSAEKGLGGVSSTMGTLGKAAGALGVAFGAGQLVQGIGSAISRAEEMDSQYAISAQVIESTGGAANVSAGHVKELATEMALTTGLDKGIALEAQNILLTFTNLKNESGPMGDNFDRATRLSADMATVFGGTAASAATQLGKALQDPIAGISALKRVGVTFTEDQKKVIASLVETGDIAGAQKIILDELSTQVGGTAVASADATAIMARSWDEVTEAIGMELLPLIKDIAPQVVAMTKTVVKTLDEAGLGFHAVDRAANIFAKTLTFGLIGSVSDADDALWDFDRTVGFAMQQLEDGRDPVLNMVDWMLELATKGSLTKDNLDRMREATGLSSDQMVIAADNAGIYAEKLGYSQDASGNLAGAAAFLKDELRTGTIPAIDDTTDAAGDLAGAIEDVDEGIRNLTPWPLKPEEVWVDVNQPRLGTTTVPSRVTGNVPDKTRIAGRAAGGMVPGMRGTPQPIIAHAGERVLPLGSDRGSSVGGPNITINIGVAGDPYQTARQIADLLTRYEQANGTRITGVGS